MIALWHVCPQIYMYNPGEFILTTEALSSTAAQSSNYSPGANMTKWVEQKKELRAIRKKYIHVPDI